jgi:hypothetical protein
MTNMTHISNIHLDSANIRQNHRIYWLLHRRIYWLAHRRICWLIGTLTAFTLGEMTYMTHSLNNHLDSIDIWQKSLNLLTGTSSIGWHIDRLYTQWNNKYDPQLNKHSDSTNIQQKTSNLLIDTSPNLLTDWHIDHFYTRWNDKYDPHVKHPFRFYQYSTKITEFIDWHIPEIID